MSSEELSTMQVSAEYWLHEEKCGHIFAVTGWDDNGAYIMHGIDENRPYGDEEL